MLSNAVPKVASLYKGVLGAASGAGIYIGTYFAVYGAASNLLSQHSQMQAGTRAFTAGASRFCETTGRCCHDHAALQRMLCCVG